MFLQMTFGVLKEKKNKEREKKTRTILLVDELLRFFFSVADEIGKESQT